MKKFFAILLVLASVFCLVACGEEKAPETVDVKDAVELLTKVWEAYGEDVPFWAMGGSYEEENMTTGAPGNFSLADPDVVDSMLGLPAASVEKIDGAASLVHGMMLNNFTCGAFHVKNASDVKAVEDALKDSIANRQWVCGFPDKYVVIGIGDYVVSMFGNEELIDSFKTQTLSTYSMASVVCEENLNR